MKSFPIATILSLLPLAVFATNGPASYCIMNSDCGTPINLLAKYNWSLFKGPNNANNEQEYYINNPNLFNDNKITITATPLGHNSKYLDEYYLSSRISSSLSTTDPRFMNPEKGVSTAGIIEGNIKLDAGYKNQNDHEWPAFWMLPNVHGWPKDGEIDLFEFSPRTSHGNFITTLHGGHITNHDHPQGIRTPQGVNLNTDHNYALRWDISSNYHTGTLKFYLDGKNYGTHTLNPSNTTDAAILRGFKLGYHVILNLAMGGKMPGRIYHHYDHQTHNMTINNVSAYPINPQAQCPMPINVQASYSNQPTQQVELHWTHPTLPVNDKIKITGYQVLDYKNNPLQTVPSSSTNTTQPVGQPSQSGTYTFNLKTVCSSKRSSYSPTATATASTEPTPNKNLTARYSKTKQSTLLSWDKAKINNVKYSVLDYKHAKLGALPNCSQSTCNWSDLNVTFPKDRKDKYYIQAHYPNNHTKEAPLTVYSCQAPQDLHGRYDRQAKTVTLNWDGAQNTSLTYNITGYHNKSIAQNIKNNINGNVAHDHIDHESPSGYYYKVSSLCGSTEITVPNA